MGGLLGGVGVGGGLGGGGSRLESIDVDHLGTNVYDCIALLADKMAILPCVIYRIQCLTAPTLYTIVLDRDMLWTAIAMQ